jgi:hypothetical protein
MTVRNMMGTLAKDAVTAAGSAARHPFGTAARAAGLVKGTVKGAAGSGLVRDLIHRPAAPASTPSTGGPSTGDTAPPAEQAPTPASAPTPAPAKDPRRTGPQIVPKPVPTYDELPEPVVITAEDPTPDPVHTEPKAASRGSAHGGGAGDREEAADYVEEIEDGLDPATVDPDRP